MKNANRNRTGTKAVTVYQPVENCDEEYCTCDGHGHCLDDRIKELSGITITFGAIPGTFMASSRSVPGRLYYVTAFKGRWRCSCMRHLKSRSSFCSHILAAQVVLETATRGTRQKIKRELLEISDPGVVCDKCKGTNCKLAEERDNNYGKSKRYKCLDCNDGKKFMPRHACKGSHFSDSEVLNMFDNVCGGMRIKETFRRMMNPAGKRLPAGGHHWANDEKIRQTALESLMFGGARPRRRRLD